MTDTAQPQDTPTHRIHSMQMTIQQIAANVAQLQARRASITEKITKAKSNSSVERELQRNKQFAKLVLQMERKILSIDSDIDAVADKLNKARALFLEASGGEVHLEKEPINGNQG